MENEPIKNGIIYCRVSSVEQVENTSLESQERNCREYARREGIEVLKVFIEKGESAKTADRTEFTKAISFCSVKTNKINYFIVYKLDRFARNQQDHVSVQVILKKMGVALRSATERIDETPMGKVTEGILSVFAEFDNNVRTERSKGGMMENLKKGIWQWQAPLGFYRPLKIKGSNIAPDPITAPFIVMLFEEYAKGGHTYLSLATYLNERGFITKYGKPLRMQVVEKILKNPLYYGRIKTWGLDIKGDFEPIISEDLFNQCQKGYKKTYIKMNRSDKNPEFPLRRICSCAICGSSITGSVSKGKYPYYHHHKQNCTEAKFIPKETFEKMFTEYLDKLTPDKKYEKLFKSIVVDIWQTNYKKLDENNAKIRSEIEKLEYERQRVFDLHRTGKYTDEEFQEQKEITNKKMYAKRQMIQDNHVQEFNMEEALDHCFKFITNTSKTWTRLKKINYGHTMRFQKQIFPEKINFDGKEFGTTKLSLVYKLNELYSIDKSSLVN